MIGARPPSRSSRGRSARRSARPRRARPDRVGVRAVQRAHRAARQPRRGRAARPARHLPERVLRAAAAAVRGGRLRLPGAGQTIVNVTNGKLIRLLVDDEPFDVRYGELRRARARARPARRHPAPRGRLDARRPASAVRVALDPAGLVRPARGRRDRYEVEPLDGAAAARRAVRAGGQRAAARRASGDPRVGGRAGRAAACPSSTATTTCGVVAVHRTRGSGLRMAAAMDHEVDGPERHRDHRSESQRGPRPRHRHRRRSSPGSGCGWSSSWPTAGRASARGRPLRDQVERGARRRRGTPAGTACSPSSATTSTTSGTRADVEVDGDAELQQAVRFALFHVLQAGARAEQRRDPGQGPDRPRLRRPHVLGHRDVRAAGAHLHRAGRGRATRCAGATRRCDLARERAAAARPGGRGLPVAHDPRRGVLGLLAGRHGRVPHQRRHRRRRRAATSPPPATTTFEREVGLELLVETARLWRSLGHHDAHGQFRIDGVTGPDEYTAIADNNVYTNLMAQRNLRAAADAAERHPDRGRGARRRRRGDGELARRRRRR